MPTSFIIPAPSCRPSEMRSRVALLRNAVRVDFPGGTLTSIGGNRFRLTLPDGPATEAPQTAADASETASAPRRAARVRKASPSAEKASPSARPSKPPKE